MTARLRLLLLALLVAAACASAAERTPKVIAVRVVSATLPDGTAVDCSGADDAWLAAGDVPARVELAVVLDNPLRGARIRRGRVLLSSGGRRAVMLTLDGTVKVPARRESEITVPLRVNVAGNSALLAVRAALRRGDLEAVVAEWEISLRGATFRGSAPLSELWPADESGRELGFPDEAVYGSGCDE